MHPKLAVLIDRTVGRPSYKIHAWLYRKTRGRIGHRSPQGPMLLITTIGRKSGQERTTPLLYMADGDRFVVVGSNGGRPQAPAWILNLRAHPEATIQVGRRRLRVRADILEGDARDEIWERLRDYYRGWSHYQTLTDRQIHPVVLTPTL